MSTKWGGCVCVVVCVPYLCLCVCAGVCVPYLCVLRCVYPLRACLCVRVCVYVCLSVSPPNPACPALTQTMTSLRARSKRICRRASSLLC